MATDLITDYADFFDLYDGLTSDYADSFVFAWWIYIVHALSFQLNPSIYESF